MDRIKYRDKLVFPDRLLVLDEPTQGFLRKIRDEHRLHFSVYKSTLEQNNKEKLSVHSVKKY